MFDEYLKVKVKESKQHKLSRFGIALMAAAILTLAGPSISSLFYSGPDSTFGVLLARILNLPAVLYCIFGHVRGVVPVGDESLYCWSVGFFFNMPYYTIVIYVASTAVARIHRYFGHFGDHLSEV